LGSSRRYVPCRSWRFITSTGDCELHQSVVSRNSGRLCLVPGMVVRVCSSGLILKGIPGCRVHLSIDPTLGRTRAELCRILQEDTTWYCMGIACVEKEGMIEIVLEISVTVVRPCTWRAPRAAFLPPRGPGPPFPLPLALISLPVAPQPARLFRPTFNYSSLFSHSPSPPTATMHFFRDICIHS